MYQPSQPIKLLAIDIDGTLLNRDKHITPRTRDTIRAAQAAGIIVVLATARRYQNSVSFAEELDITLPLILCDGTLTIQYPQQTVVATHLFDPDSAQHAVNALVQHAIQPVIHHITEHGEETWSGPHEFDNTELAPYFNLYPDIKRLPHHMLCTGKPEPLRIVAFASLETINAVAPAITSIDCTSYTIERGNYGSAEIIAMNSKCSKATALTALARTFAISMGQVMAIGDGVNDREMLQAAGWGVAMGHASDAVKAVADAVTGNNSEDGAAQAIERYVLCDERYSLSNSRSRAI
jgi:Cof subfamily protein (haloacid dehalogenase superfamily)